MRASSLSSHVIGVNSPSGGVEVTEQAGGGGAEGDVQDSQVGGAVGGDEKDGAEGGAGDVDAVAEALEDELGKGVRAVVGQGIEGGLEGAALGVAGGVLEVPQGHADDVEALRVVGQGGVDGGHPHLRCRNAGGGGDKGK